MQLPNSTRWPQPLMTIPTLDTQEARIPLQRRTIRHSTLATGWTSRRLMLTRKCLPRVLGTWRIPLSLSPHKCRCAHQLNALQLAATRKPTPTPVTPESHKCHTRPLEVVSYVPYHSELAQSAETPCKPDLTKLVSIKKDRDSLLGEGSYGQVYLGWYQKNGQDIPVSVLHCLVAAFLMEVRSR